MEWVVMESLQHAFKATGLSGISGLIRKPDDVSMTVTIATIAITRHPSSCIKNC